MTASQPNTLYYGDNLDILRERIADASVDLIYLDPPFNSQRSYNLLFRDEQGRLSDAQITAFGDTWQWGASAERLYGDLLCDAPAQVGTMIGAMWQMLGRSPMMAYLVMMTARLVELHRVLRPTGSLYLHCDPTASHYLKILLDAIFGPQNFRNEIVWKRTSGRKAGKQFGKVHDTLLFYTCGDCATWTPPTIPQTAATARGHDVIEEDGILYRLSDLSGGGSGPPRSFGGREIAPPAGRHWQYDQAEIDHLFASGRIIFNTRGIPRLKNRLDDLDGLAVTDVWTDIGPLNAAAKERLGYPTQKPIALLDRIIAASSNPGDVVLDPFCGCGTAIAAAELLGRAWIGIDVTHLAISIQKSRLAEMFPGIAYQVIGEPEDIGAARALAQQDRYQFQWWALSLVRARPLGEAGDGKRGKKGADRGIDGLITFVDEATAAPKRALIQVKSGRVSAGDVRDLRGVIERERAALGAFITLEEPTREMRLEATSAGFYRSPGWGRDFPRLQILPVGDLLQGRAQLQMPPTVGPFKRAERAERAGVEQSELW